jgi:hypothetical protein
MTREELAVMTDDELLAFQRAKHGNPYMPLSMAKKMQREEDKWRHLKEAATGTPREPCRYGDGTCLTHSGGRTQ